MCIWRSNGGIEGVVAHVALSKPVARRSQRNGGRWYHVVAVNSAK